MIAPGHPKLSLSRQCHLLRVSRSSVYHRPKGESAENLGLMRRIDELFLKYPFYGSRQMVRHLWREGVGVGRHRVRRLMRLMGLQAIYQAPWTTRPHPEHRVYPYLLKGGAIERPNHVWCADLTYIPVQKGFLYLVAVMDWATRRVLAWRLSNTLDARFCTDALTEALERYGRPEIFNTDQGSQFTSLEFTSVPFCPRRLHPGGGLRTRTPEAARASHPARPSASSIGTARRDKQDSGGMIERLEYTLTRPPSCPTNQDHLNICS